jgi:hypothetical protein
VGTGNVGRHSLRGILERPELELAALRVYNKAKVGVDAGTMLGHTQVGIAATDDAKTILGAEADVVMYNALGTTLVSLDGPVEDIARLLETGKNVIARIRVESDGRCRARPAIAPGSSTSRATRGFTSR